jgi:N-acetylmuramoyl-L-alanine amidase
MKKIVIQAGHVNTTTGSTGAPNEMSFTLDIANTVSGELRKRGFEVKQTDANANKDTSITSVDWDLFLAIHYDADIYGTGGYFVDYPEPSTDGATKESQRIKKVIEEEYGKVTGIVNHPERSNSNTRYYYIWKSLSAKTPCNLIECGVGMHVPDDWQILHFDRPRVVEAIVRGICKAFNVPYDIAPPVVEPSTNNCPQQLELANKKIDELTGLINNVKQIVHGKGWIWLKISNLKKLLV